MTITEWDSYEAWSRNEAERIIGEDLAAIAATSGIMAPTENIPPRVAMGPGRPERDGETGPKYHVHP